MEYIITIDESKADPLGGIPVKDRREVVRCRDCKHCDNHDDWLMCQLPDCDGGYANWMVEPDGFCAWGTKTDFVTCKCGEDIERLDRIQVCPSCGRRLMA